MCVYVCVNVFIFLLFGEWSGGRRVGSGQQTPKGKHCKSSKKSNIFFLHTVFRIYFRESLSWIDIEQAFNRKVFLATLTMEKLFGEHLFIH